MQRLADDYSASAAQYDRLWGPVILPFGIQLLDRLPLDSSTALLDLGTGTGGLLPHLRANAPKADIFGVDRSEGMLHCAQGHDRLFLAAADAQQLAFRPDSFDVAILMFVMFHLPDPLRGLQECARVLRCGGWVGLTTWAIDPGLPGVHIWAEELDRCGARADPRDSTVRQHGAVDDPDKVNRLLEGAGLGNIQIWAQSFAREWDHDSLMLVQQSCGPPARRLTTVPAEARDACAGRVRERIAKLNVDEMVWRPKVLFAVAEKEHAL